MQFCRASHVAGRFVFLDTTAPGEGAVSREIVPMSAPIDSSNPASTSSLHAAFLELVPTLRTHGLVVFRFLKCEDKREDAIAEMIALSWRWFIRLVQLGKDPTEFPTAIATYAAKAVKSGRRLARMERPNDVLSPRAQRLRGFTVESLPLSTRTSHERLFAHVHGQRKQDVFEERLRDNTQSPVPDQAIFRIDFPAWLDTLTGRERRLIRAMARNERTKDLSKTFQLSPGRISQLRKEFKGAWTRFCGDEKETESVAAV
jgi:hypothetical protein